MNDSQLNNTLSTLVSEQRNPDTMDLDTLSTMELVTKLNQQDQLVPLAVEKELPQIAKAVDLISDAFGSGGRLLYVGAGTSGRLGVLDASECPPTFGVDESMVIGLIAGGSEAIYRSQEGAEDSMDLGETDLINEQLNASDVVVGIAASGRTPYVVGALRYANSINARTVALSCNPNSTIAQLADVAISPVVGPEALTGSTRLKSGTAQKLILNMLSTASMVKIGKSYENLMVDVQTSNEKLRVRAVRILMQATGCTDDEAAHLLEKSQNQLKTAIFMQLTGTSVVAANERLASVSGNLRKALSF